MGPKAPKSSTTTTKTEPWAEQIPYLKDIYARAKGKSGDAQVFQGPRTAGATPEELLARSGMGNFAGGQLGQMSGLAAGNVQDVLSGKYLDPATNPHLSKTADAITALSNRNLNKTMAGLDSAAISGGAFGGVRDAVARGQALGDTQMGLDNIIAQMYLQNYNAERTRMMDPSTFQYGMEAGLAPSMIYQQIGAAKRSDEQAAIDDAMAQFLDTKNAPWENLERYAGLVGGAISGGGTVTTPLPRQGGGMLAGGIQGAMGGASTGAMFGPWGALAGGVIGGGLGALGSRR